MLPRLFLTTLIIFGVAAAHAAAPRLPVYVSFGQGINPPNPDNIVFEAYGEAEFYPEGDGDFIVRQGKHWHIDVSAAGLPDDAEQKAAWSRLKPSFLAMGWTIFGEREINPFVGTLHLQKPNLEAWAQVSVFGPTDIRIDIVELGRPALTHVLAPPAPVPERIADEQGDIPWLKPIPGSKFESGGRDPAPMEVTMPDANEPTIVAPGSLTRHYTAPDGFSTLLFATVYRDALQNAGWTIVEQSQGIHQSDATFTAHYARNGRDIWAQLHGTPTGYSIRVSDAGAKDLGGELTKQCHVVVYGVFFDFDKATLKPESDAALMRMQTMLEKTPSLKVEIQGHTDGVGSDAYNLTLSDARAHSVAAWLVQHGIAADRLIAKGYGKTMPIAPNDTDEGRAKNRRVEVARPDCRGR